LRECQRLALELGGSRCNGELPLRAAKLEVRTRYL
jgi:hypothetical protein